MQTIVEEVNRPVGTTIWLTGLSGAGKSTIADALKLKVEKVYGAKVVVLDGDVIRRGLNRY